MSEDIKLLVLENRTQGDDQTTASSEPEPFEEETITETYEQRKRKKKEMGILSNLFQGPKEGSKKAAIISEMAAILGAAILGLPYNLKQTGLVLGSAFIIFGGFLNYLSVKCLMYVSFRKNAKTYADCVYQSLGAFAGRFFEYSMIVHIYCSTITYQMLGQNFVHQICKRAGWFTSLLDTQDFKKYQILLFAVVIFPYACKKDMYALRHASTLTLAIIAYILLIITLEFPSYFRENFQNAKTSINYASFDWSVPDTFAVTAFAYLCTVNIFQVRNELRKTSENKMEHVNNRSNLYVMALYLFAGIIGYVSFVDKTPQFVNLRPPLNPEDHDYLMKIGQVAMTISIAILAPAIRVIPCRELMLSTWKMEEYSDNTPLRYVLTAAVIFPSAAVAIWYPDAYSYICFAGGTVGTLIGILFPCACYIAVTKGWHCQRILAVFALIVGFVLGFTAGYLNLIKIKG